MNNPNPLLILERNRHFYLLFLVGFLNMIRRVEIILDGIAFHNFPLRHRFQRMQPHTASPTVPNAVFDGFTSALIFLHPTGAGKTVDKAQHHHQKTKKIYHDLFSLCLIVTLSFLVYHSSLSAQK